MALIQIVDGDDKPIGSAEKKEAHQKGLIHRISRIMLFDSKGRLLLQKRVKTADNWPNCWTYSASGHVDAGETYEQAAEREMTEEIGVSGIELEEVFYDHIEVYANGHKLKRFTKDFRGFIEETPQNLQADEVSEVRWFTNEELKKAIDEHPEEFTPSIQDKKWLEYK